MSENLCDYCKKPIVIFPAQSLGDTENMHLICAITADNTQTVDREEEPEILVASKSDKPAFPEIKLHENQTKPWTPDYRQVDIFAGPTESKGTDK